MDDPALQLESPPEPRQRRPGQRLPDPPDDRPRRSTSSRCADSDPDSDWRERSPGQIGPGSLARRARVCDSCRIRCTAEVIDGSPSDVTSASSREWTDAASAAWDASPSSIGGPVGTTRLIERERRGRDGNARSPSSRPRRTGWSSTATRSPSPPQARAASDYGFMTLAAVARERSAVRARRSRTRPAYRFRGLHVDLARQWFEPEVVERLIDVAAWRKLSHLHLHLTDDEAWRLPVAAFPELAAVAGVRGHGLPLPPMLGGGADPVGRDLHARRDRRAGSRGPTSWASCSCPRSTCPLTCMPRSLHCPHLRDPDDASQRGQRAVLHRQRARAGPPVDDAVRRGRGRRRRRRCSRAHRGSTSAATRCRTARGAVRRSSPGSCASAACRMSTTSRPRSTANVVRHDQDATGRRIAAWQEAAESGGVAPGDGYVVGWRTVEASRELAAEGYDVVVSPGQAYYLDMAVDDDWRRRARRGPAAARSRTCASSIPSTAGPTRSCAHLLGIQACLWTEHVHDEQALHDSCSRASTPSPNGHGPVDHGRRGVAPRPSGASTHAIDDHHLHSWIPSTRSPGCCVPFDGGHALRPTAVVTLDDLEGCGAGRLGSQPAQRLCRVEDGRSRCGYTVAR